MEITAQQRKWPTKLREKVNLKGKLLEQFSPEFRELMDTLRDVDDKVREEATDLKDLLKVAKTNLNRREYMTAASYVGRFHEKMEKIYQELARLGNVVDVKHHDFLFGGLEPEHLEYLTTKMSPKMELYKKLQDLGKKASIEKEAGITDWWHNITTDRGRTLGAWEKRFPKYARELKNQTEALITKSEAFYALLINSLKVMASYRATRKLEDYLKTVSKLKERFRSYHTAFANYYNTQVKRFVEYQKALETTPVTPDKVETSVSQSAIPSKVETPVSQPVPADEMDDPNDAPVIIDSKGRTHTQYGGVLTKPLNWDKIKNQPHRDFPHLTYEQVRDWVRAEYFKNKSKPAATQPVPVPVPKEPASEEPAPTQAEQAELPFPLVEEKPKKAMALRQLLFSLAEDL
jgi:hypothetical protein